MVQICEYLLVPYCLKGGIFPVRKQRPHFIFQAGIHHLQHPPVNPVVQHIAWTCQPYFLYQEITLFTGCGLERRKLPPGHKTDLKSPDNPLSVGNVYGGIAFRIKPFQFKPQGLHPFLSKPAGQFGPELQVRRRKIIQAVAQGIYIEA